MTWSMRIRQIHRWTSIAFTLTVIVNIVFNIAASGEETAAVWVGIAALIPLILLLLTGLYMFALPYVAKRRAVTEE